MAHYRPSLRFARMLEHHSTRLAQRIAAPRVVGAAHSPASGGAPEQWTPAADQDRDHDRDRDRDGVEGHTPWIVVVTDRPISAQWISASLAVALHAQVTVTRGDMLAADRIADAVVGLHAAAPTALDLCRRLRARRLALVSPRQLPTSVPTGLPTTLIQAAAFGPERPQVREFERTLRATGTAVRDTDYPATPDEWVRLPRLVRGSTAALGDLVAFLERGIGVQSTFEVIPGWDLH